MRQRNLRFTEAKRVNPATCPTCGKRDIYTAEVYGVSEGIVWLCRHCEDGWIDLAASVPQGYKPWPQQGRR